MSRKIFNERPLRFPRLRPDLLHVAGHGLDGGLELTPVDRRASRPPQGYRPASLLKDDRVARSYARLVRQLLRDGDLELLGDLILLPSITSLL